MRPFFSPFSRAVALSIAFAIALLFSYRLEASSRNHHRLSSSESIKDATARAAMATTASATSHEPDFAMIEKIYKRGQLRAAAARRQMNVDALPPDNAALPESRFIWDLFYPDYNCPYGKSRLGRVGDGGKWLCGVERFLSKPGCVVYSLGSNAETSFETDIAHETECEIQVFDPTQTSVPMPSTPRAGNKNFHRYAIGDPAQNSTWETKSLEAVMRGFGHTWIDVLKMDIEGGEWTFLEYLLQSGKPIPVGQVREPLFFFLSV
jgi:Methyltransferase domain